MIAFGVQSDDPFYGAGNVSVPWNDTASATSPGTIEVDAKSEDAKAAADSIAATGKTVAIVAGVGLAAVALALLVRSRR